MMGDYMKNQGLVDGITGCRNRQRQLEAEIERLKANRADYADRQVALSKQANEIERLTVRNKNQCERLDQQIKHNADLLNRNAKLQAVVDAATNLVRAQGTAISTYWDELDEAIDIMEDDDE